MAQNSFIRFHMAEISTRDDLSAVCADAVCLYHTAELNIGHAGGLMPYGNANELVKKMSASLALDRLGIPVYAGVCGADPICLMKPLLRELKAHGVTGVQNFPSVGMADQIFRCNLEAVHLGCRREAEMLIAAKGEGLEIFPFVSSLSDAVALASAAPRRMIYDLGFGFSQQFPKKSASFWLERIRAMRSFFDKVLPELELYLFVRNPRLKTLIETDSRTPGLIAGFYESFRIERKEGE